jgi:transcriptional regulator with XRE-family HTH domain
MAKKNNQPVDDTKRLGRPARTAEEVARHKAIRERFQRERPSLEQLISSGEYNDPLPMGEYLSIRQAVFALKKAREAAGLSLADVAERTGIDKAALSRIETGQHMNPTVSTLCRYAHAVGKRWKWVLEEEVSSGGEESSTQMSRFAEPSGQETADSAASDARRQMLENIRVPEYISLEPPKGFGFPPWRVFEVRAGASGQSIVRWKDLKATIYAKSQPSYTDLICLRDDEQKQPVVFAIRVFPDLCNEPLEDLPPVKILEHFIDRFGLPIRVGPHTGKFFLEQEFSVPTIVIPGVPEGQVISVDHPKNSSFITSFFFRVDPPVVKIALAFCIDGEEYLRWQKGR